MTYRDTHYLWKIEDADTIETIKSEFEKMIAFILPMVITDLLHLIYYIRMKKTIIQIINRDESIIFLCPI